MQRTEEANQAPFPFDTGGLARMQSWMLARHEAEGPQVASGAENGFDISLSVVEVDRVATVGPTFRQTGTTEHARQHRLLLQAFKLANEAQATFE
ncbi:hypothetical protein D9M68_733290 [compost metagenome]